MAINPVSEQTASGSEHSTPKPVEQPQSFRERASEGARRLAERVRSLIVRQPPKPDEALRVVATAPLPESQHAPQQNVSDQKPAADGFLIPPKSESDLSIKEAGVKIAHIDLATHGQQFEHLFGMYAQVPIKGLEKAMQIRSKEENNYFGIGVKAYSPNGEGEAFEPGEPRTSFMKGGIYGGEIIWVAPVGEILTKGGYVQTIHENPQSEGLVGNGEFGHYSELGYRLHKIRSFDAEQKVLESIGELLDQGKIDSAKFDFARFILDRQIENGNEAARYEWEYTEKVRKEINSLTGDELKLRLEEERRKIAGEEKQLKATLGEAENDSGIDLLTTSFICFVPEDKVAEVKARIEQLSLTDTQKDFLRNQLKPYKDLMELDKYIGEMQNNPSIFARLIRAKAPIEDTLIEDQERLKPGHFKQIAPTIYKVLNN